MLKELRSILGEEHKCICVLNVVIPFDIINWFGEHQIDKGPKLTSCKWPLEEQF